MQGFVQMLVEEDGATESGVGLIGLIGLFGFRKSPAWDEGKASVLDLLTKQGIHPFGCCQRKTKVSPQEVEELQLRKHPLQQLIFLVSNCFAL